MNEARNRQLRVGRGFFRLWLVLSVLWLFAAGATRFDRLLSLYESATFNIVPVAQPQGTYGVQWNALTSTQKTFVSNWYEKRRAAIKAELPKPASERDEIANAARVVRLGWPEHLSYKLVPIADLEPEEADWLRNVWIKERREWLAIALGDFATLGLGIPLAIGILGFLALLTCRWIWAGFIGAK